MTTNGGTAGLSFEVEFWFGAFADESGKGAEEVWCVSNVHH